MGGHVCQDTAGKDYQTIEIKQLTGGSFCNATDINIFRVIDEPADMHVEHSTLNTVYLQQQAEEELFPYVAKLCVLC